MRFLPVAILLLAYAAFAQDLNELTGQTGASSSRLLKKGLMPALPGTTSDQAARLVTDRALVDSEYVVGPGDVFSIYLGEIRQYIVNAEGFLQLPDFAPVNLSGLDLREARARIKRELRRGYDTSKVHISLAMAKSFKVHVLGEVLNPGAKTVTGFARVDELILHSGGFSGSALRDRVWILHVDGDTTVADLQRYFQKFGDADNPRLNLGDKVIVKAIDPVSPYAVIRFKNEVAFHQADGRHNLKQVVSQLSVYSANEYLPRARVTGADGRVARLEPEAAAAYVPKGGDTIEVFKDNENVFVGGAVSRPAGYPYVPGFTAQDYLYQAGLLPYTEDEGAYHLIRDGRALRPGDVEKTGVKPGDKVRIDRSRIESSRDYLSIVASLAGIVLSAATLYYTARNN